MLLHDARRAAADADGELVTLDQQDRTRWDRALIAEGVRPRRGAAPGRAGAYQVQAAIAACHATAPTPRAPTGPRSPPCTPGSRGWRRPRSWSSTGRSRWPWPTAPTPGCPGRRARGVRRLDGYHLLPATRADLLRRAGRAAEARAAYEQALDLAPTEAERRYLTARLDEL